MADWPHPVRRMLQRLVGEGPVSVAPFAAIGHDRWSYDRGVHRPEDFSGVLTHRPVPPMRYVAGESLLGQPGTCEMLPSGRRYRESGVAAMPELRAYLLDDAGLVTADGIAYCRRSRRAVAESMRRWTAPLHRHPVLSAPRFPAARRLPGLSLSLATLSGDGFYHFLLESLTRVGLVMPWLDAFDHILVNGRPQGFHRDWLELAGIQPGKLVWLDGLSHYACEQLVFTDYPMADYRPSCWHAEVLRRAVSAPAPARRFRRIWISRADATSRRIAWEDALVRQLEGFEKVTLARLSPREQVELMAEADCVAGPHGAGLANLVFAGADVRLVELFPGSDRQPVYQRLVQTVGGRGAWAVVDFAASEPPVGLADAIRRFVDAQRPPC